MWPDIVELMRCADEVAGKEWCDRHLGPDGAGFADKVPPLGRDDRNFFRDPVRADLFRRDMRESLRQGTGGFAQDTVLENQPWEFDPGTITVPVRVLHGETDVTLPLAHSRHNAELIPGVELEVIAGHGHLSILAEFPAIAADLATRLR